MVDWSRQFLENNNLAEPDPLTDTVHTVSQIPVPGSKGGTFLLTYNVPVPLYLYTREVRKYKSNLIHSQTLHRKITFRYLSSRHSFPQLLGEKNWSPVPSIPVLRIRTPFVQIRIRLRGPDPALDPEP